MSMWSKRNEQEFPPTPVEPRPNTAPVAVSPPTLTAQPKRASIIGSTVMIKGEIQAKEELIIDGEVEGSLDSQDKISVGTSGKVKAQLRAKEIVVRGHIWHELSEKYA